MLKSCTTARIALRAIRDAVGLKDTPSNQRKSLEILNEIRQWVYSQQRQLAVDLSKTLCIQVQNFCSDCSSCAVTHRGFRLPQNTISVEAVQINNRHVDVHDHWRLPYDGIAGSPCDGQIRLIDSGYAPTERDIDCLCPTQVSFQAINATCSEQLVIISGITNEDLEEQFQLQVGPEITIAFPIFKRITQVHFPNGSDGVVVMRQASDYKELARYEPGLHVPKFREYRLVAANCACINNITVIANCSYADVYDECDVVEFGNVLVWKWLAKYLQSMGRGDLNGNDRANLTLWLQTATDMMVQEAAVEEGENTVTIFQRAPLGQCGDLNAQRQSYAHR